MSDLQISLLVIGALAVAGVYLFNSWQERQLRRRAEQAFARDHADVLLRESGDVAGQEPVPAERVEPKLATAPAASTSARKAAEGVPDPLIDYVVEVHLGVPADGADLHEELMALTAGWGKPVLVSGYGRGSDEWHKAGVGDSSAYLQLRFALQLANRGGCVESAQLAAFRDAVVDWAEHRQGEVKCIDAAEAHTKAVQLDRFCADVDIAIGVNVVARETGAFSGTKIRALAEAAGLRLEPDGVFYARGDHGDTRFTIDNHEPMPFVPEQMKTLSTKGITFLLDVPRVDAAVDAFDTMVQTAKSFTAALNGILVDDNGNPLPDDAIETIRERLKVILEKMEAAQLAAGGARALRLFS